MKSDEVACGNVSAEIDAGRFRLIGARRDFHLCHVEASLFVSRELLAKGILQGRELLLVPLRQSALRKCFKALLHSQPFARQLGKLGHMLLEHLQLGLYPRLWNGSSSRAFPRSSCRRHTAETP